MKKVTVLGIVALAATVLLFDFSEGAGDFFHILDQTTAEYLMGDSIKLYRSSSGAAMTGPRNNKYLEASMQIIRGNKAMLFSSLFCVSVHYTDGTKPHLLRKRATLSTVDFSMKLKRGNLRTHG